MMQFRYDRARQPAPFASSRPSQIEPRPKSKRKRLGRRPDAIVGGKGSGTLCHAPLVRIEAAMVAHGIAASRFGRDAANDAGLVSRLRCRPSVTPEMRDRLNAFIDALDSGEVVNG